MLVTGFTKPEGADCEQARELIGVRATVHTKRCERTLAWQLRHGRDAVAEDVIVLCLRRPPRMPEVSVFSVF